MADSTIHIIAVSEYLYRRLLRAYPADFRHRYGSQMTQVFLDSCREAYQQHGNSGIDRWLGGVHLQGQDAAWRWDVQQARLVQGQGTA